MRIDAEERTRRIEAIAQEALALFGAGRQVEPFASRHPGFDLNEAYGVAARVRALRAARGEQAVGRKIGFTNPTVQRLYGVHGPIWNFMFDSTVHDLAAIGGRFTLEGLPEPRIEPEIVFHLAAAPRADMDDEALLGCVDWVAHGFEIVQSIFPGWRFTAADSVAAYGLHGAYFLGPRHPVADDRRAWAARALGVHDRAFERWRRRLAGTWQKCPRRAARGAAPSGARARIRPRLAIPFGPGRS